MKICVMMMVFLSFSSFAQNLEFSAIVTKKYTKEVSEILKNKSEYYCKTESIPYFVISDEAYKELHAQVQVLKKESKKNISTKNCSRNEIFQLMINKETSQFCLDNPEAKLLQLILSKRCGRSL